MSQIAAILLMYLNEEDAFWALSQLLTNNNHAMHGEQGRRGRERDVGWVKELVRLLLNYCHRPCLHSYFTFLTWLLTMHPLSFCLCMCVVGFFIPGFPKLQRYQAHHEQILSKLLPKLKKHLVRNAFP